MATPIVGAVFKSGSRRMKQGGVNMQIAGVVNCFVWMACLFDLSDESFDQEGHGLLRLPRSIPFICIGSMCP